jgi:hypothetical protein
MHVVHVVCDDEGSGVQAMGIEKISDSGHRAWGTRQRVATGLNVSVSVMCAFLALLMLNYLSGRFFYLRADRSTRRFYSLSEKTRSMMSALRGDISVVVLVRAANDEKKDTLRDIMSLLDEYEQVSRGVEGLRLKARRIDPDRDLSMTEAVQQKYGLTSADVVVFVSGDRTKVVPLRQIVEYDFKPTMGGMTAVRRAFRGEEMFSSAILSVTQEDVPVACFVRGHGEHEVTDFAKHEGYSDVSKRIRQDNIEVRSISLLEEKGIPADCDLLIIGGPKKSFHESEALAIGNYLQRNGSLFLLIDAGRTSGLESLLREWGVHLPAAKVVEKTLVLVGGDDGFVALPQTGEELCIRRWGRHRITERLEEGSAVFYLPRPILPSPLTSVGSARTTDRPRLAVLAESTEDGWAETDFGQTPPEYDPGLDIRGPVPVAIAAERGPTGSDMELRSARIVVAGDSDFVVNGRTAGGNEDFFMGALNWLLERESLIGVGPKLYDRIPLRMDDRQALWAFLVLVVIVPGTVFLVGLSVWLMRVH